MPRRAKKEPRCLELHQNHVEMIECKTPGAFLMAFRKWAENRGVFELCAGVNSGAHIERTDRFLRRLGFVQTGGNYALRLSASKSTTPAQMTKENLIRQPIDFMDQKSRSYDKTVRES